MGLDPNTNLLVQPTDPAMVANQLQMLGNNLKNTMSTQSEANEIQEALPGFSLPKYQQEIQYFNSDCRIGASDTTDYRQELNFSVVPNGFFHPSSMNLHMKLQIVDKDGKTIATPSNNAWLRQDFIGALFEKITVTQRNTTKQLFNTNKIAISDAVYLNQVVDIFPDKLHTVAPHLNTNIPNLGRPIATRASETDFPNSDLLKQNMGTDIYKDTGEEFIIPLGMLQTFFKNEGYVPPQIQYDIRFYLQREDKKLIEVKDKISATDKATRSIYKLKIIGKPELRWREHTGTIEAGSMMDKGFSINPHFNLNNGNPIMDFTVNSYTIPANTTYFTTVIDFGYLQPVGIIFMLQPSVSERHDTHFDTSNVSSFPIDVKNFSLSGLSKDSSILEDIMYDLTDERHKRRLYDDFISFINHVNFVDTNFSKYRNNEFFNPKTLSYSRFYEDSSTKTWNSTGMIYVDLTRDKGITEIPSALNYALTGTLEVNFKGAKTYENRLKMICVYPRNYILDTSSDGFFSISNDPSIFQNA